MYIYFPIVLKVFKLTYIFTYVRITYVRFVFCSVLLKEKKYTLKLARKKHVHHQNSNTIIIPTLN